jgi:hypothetical protein
MRQATGYDLLDQVRAIPRLAEIPLRENIFWKTTWDVRVLGRSIG